MKKHTNLCNDLPPWTAGSFVLKSVALDTIIDTVLPNHMILLQLLVLKF